MSFTKRMMERRERQVELAGVIAVDARVLRRCEMHGHLMAGHDNIESAYKLGNHRLSNGDYAGEFEDRRAMTDAVKKAVEDNTVEDCWECERLKDA